ncbi:MAG: hypothetical protein ACT4QD_21580 [Acidobacteriota bacterium]
MRRMLMVASLIAAGLVGASVVAEACGDKFLLVGRGARFQRAYASVYPGHVLVYARPGLGAKAPLRDARLHSLLRQAGHAVSVIEDESLLAQAVRSANIDILLVDLSDAARVDAMAANSVSRPRTVPVRPVVDTPELKKLQQQFMCKLKVTDNSVRWLDTIEDAMKDRVTARRASKS